MKNKTQSLCFNTSFIALFGFFLSLWVLSGSLLPESAFAEVSGDLLFSESFESYDIDYNFPVFVGFPEPVWCVPLENRGRIRGDYVFDGERSASPNGTYSFFSPTLPASTEPTIIFYLYFISETAQIGGIGLRQDATTISHIDLLSADEAGIGVWHKFQIETKNIDGVIAEYRLKFNLENWSDWASTTNPLSYANQIYFKGGGTGSRYDYIFYGENLDLSIPPEVEFQTPDDFSTQTDDFLITGLWNGLNTENFDTLILYLKNSDNLIKTAGKMGVDTTDGNFSFQLRTSDYWKDDWQAYVIFYKLDCDEFGNCVYVYAPTKAKDEPVLNFTLAGNFATSTEPEMEIEEFIFDPIWLNYEDFYASNSDKWTTSTAVGIFLNNSVGSVSDWLFNLSSQLKVLNLEKETAGIEIGQAIQKVKGYLSTINNLFSGFPLAQIFSAYILVFLLILILRLIKYIRGLLPF
jgi:hypothetical protein